MENNMLSLSAKLEQWEKTLPPDKLLLLTYAIKMETDNLVKNIDLNIENCMGAAIGDFTDLSIKQIKEVIKRSSEYVEDTSKYIKANGVDYMKKIEKIEGEVKEFLRNEMASGTLKSEAMLKAKKKFNVPAKDISNLWLIIKEEDYPELCKGDKGLTLEQSSKTYEERRAELIKSKNKARTEEKEVKGTNSQEKEENITEKAREGKKEHMKSSLVEITEIRRFKGQYGEYEKSAEGIKTGDVLIKDVKDIEEQKAAVEEDIKRMREEFEKTISEKRILALGKLNEAMELLSM